jgi:mono/diheme cytochrome c family protein
MLKRLRKEFRDMRGAEILTVMGYNIATAALILLLGTGLAYGWPWSADMIKQPSVKPQTAPRVSPAESVPIQGKEPSMDRIEAGKKLRNPVEATAASVENGKRLFNTYCASCHGPEARGDGPVAKKFIPPPDLRLEVFRQRPDGFIYETIRNGGPLMPGQGEALLPRERWEIVNYLRTLQGK